jgi:NAD(P)H dehydrogenase (quinone)
MSKLLIVYHTYTGNTEAMAKAIYDAAVSAGATATIKKANEATAEDLINCDVIALGTPMAFRYMAGVMKDFLDRVWMTIEEGVGDKMYATFGSAGGGGRQAIESIEQICETFSEWKRVSFKKAL